MGGRHFYTYDAFSEVSLTDAYVIYSAGPQPSLARVTNKTQNTMLLKGVSHPAPDGLRVHFGR